MANEEVKLQNLVRKIETLVYNFNNIDDYEKEILNAVLDQQGQREFRSMSLTLAECHVIDCIERNERINPTAIAKKLNITKGGISKITAKLIKKKLIETQRLPHNQKEIYYTLTPLGEKIFQAHAVLHVKEEEKFLTLLRAYSKEELTVIGRFLDNMITAFESVTAEKGGES